MADDIDLRTDAWEHLAVVCSAAGIAFYRNGTASKTLPGTLLSRPLVRLLFSLNHFSLLSWTEIPMLFKL